MSEQQILCPKCGGAMKMGDFSAGGNTPLRWQATRIGALLKMKVKLPEGSSYDVLGCRCESCGYIELYARTTS